MDELISIIVPIYNVADYLSKCIESVINQTYKNIEIILVNDGSTDDSLEICNKYAAIDDRIIVINKENGGLSDARNAGLKAVNGNYCCFVDSDDYIELDMVENLYNAIITNDADISCCGKVMEYVKNNVYLNNLSNFSVNKTEALRRLLLKQEIDNSACDKLFKKELFEGIEFPVGRYFEDIATVYKLFLKAKSVCHIKNIGYHYVVRKDSISTEEFSSKQLDALIFSKQMTEDIFSAYPELEKQAEVFYCLELMTTLRKIKRASNAKQYKNEYKKIKREFNKNIFKIISNKYIVWYKKIMAILIYFCLYPLVEMFYNIISKKK